MSTDVMHFLRSDNNMRVFVFIYSCFLMTLYEDTVYMYFHPVSEVQYSSLA